MQKIVATKKNTLKNHGSETLSLETINSTFYAKSIYLCYKKNPTL